ncbi:MAG: hypothetical protein LBD85_04045 [Oscillospiraceae bacterium]|jgi:hypothetical protein|nr:hypothetical protein [Oscillospiraceae bacterium]
MNVSTYTNGGKDGFRIIDNTGKVLYSHYDSEERTVIPIGYVKGHFLITEHIANFDSDEWRIGSIDKFGNSLLPMETLPEFMFKIARKRSENEFSQQYLGDDWAYVAINSRRFALNLKDGEWRNLNFENLPFKHITITVVDGYIYVRDNDRGLTYKSTLTDFINDNWTSLDYFYSRYQTDLAEGLYFGISASDFDVLGESAERKYYDLSGNVVIDFPEYEDRYYYGGGFIGGYAAMCVSGVDGNKYVTVIDKNGAKQYEPIKVFDSNTIYPEPAVVASAHGYMLAPTNNNTFLRWEYLGPDGRTVIPGEDDLTILSTGTYPGLNIYDGVMTIYKRDDGTYWFMKDLAYGFKVYYINLATNEIIDKVRIPSSQFSGQGENQVNESTEVAASEYTGSFSLTGMWKSSNDSIISFNNSGTVNALFFGFGDGGPDGSWAMSSKADENGHYTLSASHITGGSPVYRVRLISKNEIELYGESGIEFGPDYYYLTRQ